MDNAHPPVMGSDTVYELWYREDGDKSQLAAVVLRFGRVHGYLDLTAELVGGRVTAERVHHDLQPRLSELPYVPQPDEGTTTQDGEAAAAAWAAEGWVVLARVSRFVSASPPAWVEDRQAVARVNTFDTPEGF
jgi:hypothetical protein